MKRFFSVLMALVLMCGLAAGCSGPQEETSSEDASTVREGDITQLTQIHICVDTLSSQTSSSLEKQLQLLPGNGKDFLPILETVPSTGAERDTTLTRIRTELMAGKGPDVFICSGDIAVADGTPLFPFPQQSMRNRLFLPLDSYIENAQYMEWDHLLPGVMEGGRSPDGDIQILPMLYELPVLFLPADNYAVQQPLPKTYQEMLDSSDPIIQYIVRGCALYDDVFGELVDYDAEEPTFTEEELIGFFKERQDFRKREEAGEFPDMTFFWEEGGFYVMKQDILSRNLFGATTNSTDQPIDTVNYTLVPIYSQDGGVTATVTEFIALNRNTEIPELAFLVADYLMADERQRNSAILAGRSNGITPNINLGHKVDGSDDTSTLQNGRGMNDWNFAQLREIEEQVSAVNFFTAANRVTYWVRDSDLEKGLHKGYMELKMMLAES